MCAFKHGIHKMIRTGRRAGVAELTVYMGNGTLAIGQLKCRLSDALHWVREDGVLLAHENAMPPVDDYNTQHCSHAAWTPCECNVGGLCQRK